MIYAMPPSASCVDVSCPSCFFFYYFARY